MNTSNILSRVDHTALKAVTTWEQIRCLCEEALKYHTASVCIPPSYVARAHQAFPELNICTVIGFPLGYNTLECKVFETKQAIENGASEVDMVVNLGDVKNGDFDAVEHEIAALKQAAGDHILKVIIETCYLTEEEKIRLCQCVTNAKADYIKTSTGFGTGGATKEDVALFAKHVGPDVKIKAAGGIADLQDAEDFIDLGASRLGTSRIVKAVKAMEQK